MENAVNSVKLLTGRAEDNTEPSLRRKLLEGVTTRSRAYWCAFALMAVIAPTSAAAERHEIVWTAWRHADGGFKRFSDNTSISPMDTWFMSNAGRGSVKSTTHEWLTDALTAANGSNAFIEGDAYSAQSRVLPARLKNYTQISCKEFAVTGTAQKIDNAGMRELLAYHTARAAKEIKRDMEKGMLGNNPASAGTSTSPRVAGAVQNWIYSPHHIAALNQTTATTTAPVGGFATATIGAGSSTALTETVLKSALQAGWSAGGEIDTILVGASLYNSISNFTGLATRFRNVNSREQAQIIGAADVYVSAFGSHNIQLSRWASSTVVYCLDISTWSVNYLRPFQTIEIAKISDEERRMLLAEWTLVAKTPLANAKITAVV